MLRKTFPRKLAKRYFSSIPQTREKNIYIPITFQLENLPKSTDKKSIFNTLKNELSIPVMGIRSFSEIGEEKNATFLADALYLQKVPEGIEFLNKEISLLDGNETFKIDFSDNTKEMIKLAKSKNFDNNSDEFKEMKKKLNEEIMKFRINGESKQRPLGKRNPKTGKKLFELLKIPSLQYHISKRSPVKVYRNKWLRNGYDEPCFWTLTKVIFKEAPKTGIKNAFGILTWRGVSEKKVKKVPSINKPEWRYIKDPITISLDPRQDPFFKPSSKTPFPYSKFSFKVLNSLPEVPKETRKKKVVKDEYLLERRKNFEEMKNRKALEEEAVIKEALETIDQTRNLRTLLWGDDASNLKRKSKLKKPNKEKESLESEEPNAESSINSEDGDVKDIDNEEGK